MAEEGRDCLTILHQLAAVEGALVQSRRMVLERHLRDCLPEALADGRMDDLVDEILIATFGGSVPPNRSHDR
jgi:DNA-binding FrmR family transcriptional regulator